MEDLIDLFLDNGKLNLLGIALMVLAIGILLGYYGYTTPGLALITGGSVLLSVSFLVAYKKKQSVVIGIGAAVLLFAAVWAASAYVSLRNISAETAYWAVLGIALIAVLALLMHLTGRDSRAT